MPSFTPGLVKGALCMRFATVSRPLVMAMTRIFRQGELVGKRQVLMGLQPNYRIGTNP